MKVSSGAQLDNINQGIDESSLMMCLPLFVGVYLVLYVLYVVDSTFDVWNLRFVVQNSHTIVWMFSSHMLMIAIMQLCLWCDRPLAMLESICACIYGMLTQLVMWESLGFFVDNLILTKHMKFVIPPARRCRVSFELWMLACACCGGYFRVAYAVGRLLVFWVGLCGDLQ